jgi:hypothetical protein
MYVENSAQERERERERERDDNGAHLQRACVLRVVHLQREQQRPQWQEQQTRVKVHQPLGQQQRVGRDPWGEGNDSSGGAARPEGVGVL